MSVFVAIALLLLALTLVSLTVPLLRNKQKKFADHESVNIAAARSRLVELEAEYAAGIIDDRQLSQLRDELEVTLASELDQQYATQRAHSPTSNRITAGIVAAGVSLLTVGLYWQLGNSAALTVNIAEGGVASSAGASGNPAQSLDALAEDLALRLRSEPNNINGWLMLAHTYKAMSRYDDAVSIYATLDSSLTDDADFLLSYADALAMADGGRISDEAFTLINKALRLEPGNTSGLWLSGIAFRERGESEMALRRFSELLPRVTDAESQAKVKALIAEAKRAVGDTSSKPQLNTTAQLPAIIVDVIISRELSTTLNGNETVFVYARAADGPRMPIVATRLNVRDLPTQIILTDSMALSPSRTLSQVSSLTVGAKISKSGSATTSSGDLYGEVSPVDTYTQEPIELRIDQRIP